MSIRRFSGHTDKAQVRACLIELQDFERDIDPRMPSGQDIVDIYIPDMLQRCRDCSGAILVAEVDRLVVGYVTILTKVSSDEIGAGDHEFGLITDVVVLQEHRGKGHGKALLQAAETYARDNGVKWLRIGALAPNKSATTLYSSMGFSGLYVELEKDLQGS
jgi:GNAT superfamily N-acetyltransferase